MSHVYFKSPQFHASLLNANVSLAPRGKKILFKLAFIKGYSAWKGVSCKDLKWSSLDDIIYIKIYICRNSSYAHNIKTCILGWHLYARIYRLHFLQKCRRDRFIFECESEGEKVDRYELFKDLKLVAVKIHLSILWSGSIGWLDTFLVSSFLSFLVWSLS